MTFYFGWPGDDSGRKNWLVKVPKERKSLYQDILDLFCQRSALVEQMKGKEGEADLFYAQEWSDQSYRPNARYMHLNNSIDIMSINLVEPVFDVQMCDALKYSVMGASTIGHEITQVSTVMVASITNSARRRTGGLRLTSRTLRSCRMRWWRTSTVRGASSSVASPMAGWRI